MSDKISKPRYKNKSSPKKYVEKKKSSPKKIPLSARRQVVSPPQVHHVHDVPAHHIQPVINRTPEDDGLGEEIE